MAGLRNTMARVHLGMACLALAIVACEGDADGPTRNPPGDAAGMRDAFVDRDASSIEDAGDGRDALAPPAPPPLDSGAPERDASVPGLDATVPPPPPPPPDAGMDASTPPDAGWGGCNSGGVDGVCMDVSTCSGMSVRGLCPGPAEIQCCLPVPDAGPRPDLGMPTGSVAEVLARLGACTRIGGDYAKDVGDSADIPVCQTDDVIWWDADMDIDCDGGRGSLCMSDPDYLPDTSGVDSMGDPLDASTLPFVVIPLASSRFRYADHGIRIGQVALVIYGDRMVFGIFGDAGPASIIGEASFAMAEALGIPSHPSRGGVDSGVTYLIFTGDSARVTRNEDHAEATRIGESLLAAFLGS